MNNLGNFYFGHPVNTYNTTIETELILRIQEEFPTNALENPNQDHHQKGYQRYKEMEGKRGMDYYFEEVLPKMTQGGIFLPFEDGMIGAGVFAEALFLKDREKPIYEISWEGIIRPLELDLERELSIEDTRKRVY